MKLRSADLRLTADTVMEMGGRRLTLRRVQPGKDGGSGRKLLLGNICGTEMGWRIQ